MICTSLGRSVGYSMASTDVILPLETVTFTRTGPYRVLAALPVTVAVPVDAVLDAAVDADEPLAAGVALAAEELAAVVAGCVLKFRRATRPVIVAAAEKMTRFIVAFPDQNSKDS